MMAGRRAGRRAFGWAADDSELVESEAAELRRIARELDAGKSMKQAVRELNDRHVPTASGNAWSVSALKRMLIRPRMIGRRTDAMGRPVQGKLAYPAVFATAEEIALWNRLRVKLTDPRRRQVRREDTALLAERIVCGVCSEAMYWQQQTGRAARYACHSEIGCGRMSIQAHLVEEYTTRRVIAHAAQVITPAVSEMQVATWWTTATPEQRRELVAGMVEAVTVKPVADAGPGENRLDITWSDTPAWPAGIATGS